MQVGIIGLPNAGKSTIFNALAHTQVEVKKHPFTTIEPNLGIVTVPDPRLEKLAEIFRPERLVPASIKFMDVAGLVEGASRGEGLGNQFLAAIRSATALAHVVRCFEAGDIAHVMGGVNPVRDVEVIRLELILSDLEMVEKRLEGIAKARHSDRHRSGEAGEVLAAIKGYLEKGEDFRGTELAEQAALFLADTPILSLKPVIYVANIGEDDLDRERNSLEALREKSRQEGAGIIELCGKLEAEIVSLPPEERETFRDALGIKESGLDRLAAAARNLLGLVTFFTKEGVEVRAWMVERGSTARQAAARIHSDMEKGFIKAEVIGFPELAEAGSLNEVRHRGHLRFEGADYRVQEGDVIRFHFKNVAS